MKKTVMYSIASLLCVALLNGCSCERDTNKKVEKKVIQNGPQEITTESGLKYIIKQAAPEGAKSPLKGKKVTVHYTGWLDVNGHPGAKFDSSLDHGSPFSFLIGMGMVIKGWDEGVLGMKVGEKRRLIIPASLAYGDRGVPGVIPPKSSLIFDVELLDVE